MENAEDRADRHRSQDGTRADLLATPAATDPTDTVSEQASWSYTAHSERGSALQFSGHVSILGGAAGERLQGRLSHAIRDLLRWAAVARKAAEESSEHQGDTAA